MKKLNIYEQKNIKAGSKAGLITALVAGTITFLVGIFDGFSRPFKCR